MQKNDIEIAQNGLPSPRQTLGGIHNISKSRCHQNLSNTDYRIKIGKHIRKNDKIRQLPGTRKRGTKGFFLYFRIHGVTKRD